MQLEREGGDPPARDQMRPSVAEEVVTQGKQKKGKPMPQFWGRRRGGQILVLITEKFRNLRGGILVGLGSYNKNARGGNTCRQQKCFSRASESPRSGCWQILYLLRPPLLVHRGLSSRCVSTWRKG